MLWPCFHFPAVRSPASTSSKSNPPCPPLVSKHTQSFPPAYSQFKLGKMIQKNDSEIIFIQKSFFLPIPSTQLPPHSAALYPLQYFHYFSVSCTCMISDSRDFAEAPFVAEGAPTSHLPAQALAAGSTVPLAQSQKGSFHHFL